MLFKSEAEIVAQVERYLQTLGYDVRNEIKFAGYLGRADVVGIIPFEMVIVECKQHLTLKLISQARAWKKLTPKVYVAVPLWTGSRSSVRGFIEEILQVFGIGLLYVSYGYVKEVHSPTPRRLPNGSETEQRQRAPTQAEVSL